MVKKFSSFKAVAINRYKFASLSFFVLLFFSLFVSPVLAAPDSKTLNFLNDQIYKVGVAKTSLNAVSLVVQTKINTDIRVDYGLTTDYGGHVRSSHKQRHVINISDLNPSTLYHYQLTMTKSGWILNEANSLVFPDATFKTQPEKGKPFSFAVMSDTHCSSPETCIYPSVVADYILNTNAELVIMPGDLIHNDQIFCSDSYQTIVSRWHIFFSELDILARNVPLYPLLGNHDAPECKNAQRAFKDEWVLPENDIDPDFGESFYSFDYGDVHFAILTDFLPNFLTTQLVWLDDDLAKTDKKWKVVANHRAPMENANEKIGRTIFADEDHPLYKILADRGVDILVHGEWHQHNVYVKRRTFFIMSPHIDNNMHISFKNTGGDAGTWETTLLRDGAYLLFDVSPTQIVVTARDITNHQVYQIGLQPSSFNLSSPADNSSSLSTRPTFSWEASSQIDTAKGLSLKKYQLYVDGVLNTDNISPEATSVTPSIALSNGLHDWYIKAVNDLGRETQSSSTYTIKVNPVSARVLEALMSVFTRLRTALEAMI